jgi:hypothetical protein
MNSRSLFSSRFCVTSASAKVSRGVLLFTFILVVMGKSFLSCEILKRTFDIPISV